MRLIGFGDRAIRFSRSIVARMVVPERGLTPDAELYPHLLAEIQHKGWGEFVRHTNNAIVPIIGEFYANIVDRSTTSFVCDRQVPFNSPTINRFFIHTNIDRDEYNRYASGQVDLEVIIRTQCMADT